MSNRDFMIIAHRGASNHCPENTIAAFRKVAELGLNMLECDIRYTKDREMVIVHDRSVDRTSNGQGLVSSMTLAQVRELDAGGWFSQEFVGERIPTLAEVCDILDTYPQLEAVLEVKDGICFPDITEKAVQYVQYRGLVDRVNISAFSWGVIGDAKAVEPQVKTSALVHFSAETNGPPPLGADDKVYHTAAELIKDATHYQATMVCPRASSISAQLVDELHDAGFLVRAWGIKGRDDAETARLIRCGVDGMTTDYPDEVLRLWQDLRG